MYHRFEFCEYNDRILLGNVLLRLYDYALLKKFPDYKKTSYFCITKIILPEEL